jgi:1-phosphatidylinositol-4-phosphate 5-kinase
MKKSEIKLLFELLPKYVRHIRMYPHTLLTRFYGVHRIVPADGRAVRFVVMGNIFRR